MHLPLETVNYFFSEPGLSHALQCEGSSSVIGDPLAKGKCLVVVHEWGRQHKPSVLKKLSQIEVGGGRNADNEGIKIRSL